MKMKIVDPLVSNSFAFPSSMHDGRNFFRTVRSFVRSCIDFDLREIKMAFFQDREEGKKRCENSKIGTIGK